MASFSVNCPKNPSLPQCSSNSRSTSHQLHRPNPNKISCLPAPNSRPSSLLSGPSINHHTTASRFQSPYQKQAAFWRLNVLLNGVAAERSSNSAPILEAKSASLDEKYEPLEELSAQNPTPCASSISAFMSEVSDLIKIVDSKDIVELQLKQLGCELIIRKKEALEQPPPAATPVFTMQSPLYQSVLPSQPPPPQVTAPPSAAPPPSAPLPALPAPPAKPSNSSHPPLQCPMAGTFYRCPAPGEPPFVKVGDKVQKGQVICIIEAMKLMNEIETDQAGTVAEILVEDGKPVSVDLPLFVIVP